MDKFTTETQIRQLCEIREKLKINARVNNIKDETTLIILTSLCIILQNQYTLHEELQEIKNQH